MTLPSAETNNPETSSNLIRCSRFNGCRDNAPKHLNYTWGQLISEEVLGRAYPVEGATRKDAKDTLPALSPAAYPFGTTRSDRNIESIQLFVLDFDNMAEQPTGETKEHGEPVFQKTQIPGAPTLDEVHQHLTDLGITHFGYHSFSSTPECERFRIIIPLDRPSDGRNWKAVSEWLLSQLDMEEWREMGCMDIGALHRAACIYYAAGYWTQEPEKKYSIRFISHDGTPLVLPTEEEVADLIVPPQPMHPLRREWAERQAAVRDASSDGNEKLYPPYGVDLNTLDIVSLLQRMGSTVQTPMAHQDGFKARCTCPFAGEHTNGQDRGDAVVFYGGSGWPRFKCMHAVHENVGTKDICIGAGVELVKQYADPYVPGARHEKAYPVTRDTDGSEVLEAEYVDPDDEEFDENSDRGKKMQVWFSKLKSHDIPIALIKFDKGGNIAKSRANLKVILSCGKDYRDSIRLNELFSLAEIRVPNYSYLKTDDLDNTLTALQVNLENEWGTTWAADSVLAVVNLVAAGNPYHPVLAWLGTLPEWDGMDRYPLICEGVLGVDETPEHEKYCELYRACIKGTLIGAVRRVLEPGWKLDTVTILYGDQAARKSTFWKTLCSDPRWFNDSKIHIDSPEGQKVLQSAWIHELSEVDDMTSMKSAEAIKAFVSSASDTFRQSYGRFARQYDRRCIMVGSTNKEQVLNDPTGSRRFWVIPTASKINIDLLKANLDQIWAQTYRLAQDGEPYHLSDEMETLRMSQSGRHQMENRFADLLHQIMGFYDSEPRPHGVTLNEVFTFLDGKVGEGTDGKTGERRGFAKPTNAERRELGACLRSHGWTVKQAFIYGSSAKCFTPPQSAFLQPPKAVLPPPGQSFVQTEDDQSAFPGLALGELL